MVSQRTVAQDANHIAGYEGYPKPSKRTERLLIFSSARGAKRDHESETTLAVVVDLGYNGDPGEGLCQTTSTLETVPRTSGRSSKTNSRNPARVL